jgi:hypothetical protein
MPELANLQFKEKHIDNLDLEINHNNKYYRNNNHSYNSHKLMINNKV